MCMKLTQNVDFPYERLSAVYEFDLSCPLFALLHARLQTIRICNLSVVVILYCVCGGGGIVSNIVNAKDLSMH